MNAIIDKLMSKLDQLSQGDTFERCSMWLVDEPGATDDHELEPCLRCRSPVGAVGSHMLNGSFVIGSCADNPQAIGAPHAPSPTGGGHVFRRSTRSHLQVTRRTDVSDKLRLMKPIPQRPARRSMKQLGLNGCPSQQPVVGLSGSACWVTWTAWQHVVHQMPDQRR